jgi:DNA-binding LacI/PurR family transcriptional regulator
LNDRPTIRTLAKLAGVSNATVSLALRNHPRIRASERERIQKIAAEAGYKTNALVSHLTAQMRLSRTSTYQSTLGLICVSKEAASLKQVSTFRDWIDGCRERASLLGYGFDEFILCETKMTPARLVQILDTRDVRGLLIVGPFSNNILPPELAPLWERSASIVLGIRPIEPSLAFVANDQFSTAAQAVRELKKLGYKRFGFCVHPDVDSLVENRFSGGFSVEQSKLPPKDRLPLFHFKPDREKDFRLWVERHQPDVILTLHPEVMKWTKAMGLDIPGDIGIVHLDRTADFENWAGVQQNNLHIGRAAVDMVVGQLHRNEFGVPPFQKCMFISGTWVNGPTVRSQNSPAPKPKPRKKSR